MDIIAHRGASADAPENTLAAFRLAWAQGADGIELDAHLSRDDRVMVHHDADTRATAGVARVIAATDSAELRALDVGAWRGEAYAGETMPVLEVVLAGVPPGRRVLVELKCGPGIVPALVRALAASPPGVRVDVIAMNLEALAACGRVLPGVPRYWVVPWREGTGPLPISLVDTAREAGLTGLDPDHRGIDAALAAAARAAGLGLMAWTVNRLADARRLRSLGLEAVTTDCPGALRRALAAPDGQDPAQGEGEQGR